jgi:hypothetical protein
MRVYELARELGVDNTELLRALRASGITVRNHMTALPDQVTDALRLGAHVVDVGPLYQSEQNTNRFVPTVRRRAGAVPRTVAAARLSSAGSPTIGTGWRPPAQGPMATDSVFAAGSSVEEPRPELRQVAASAIARAMSVDPIALVALLDHAGLGVAATETLVCLDAVLSALARHGATMSPELPTRALALRVRVHLREAQDSDEAEKAIDQSVAARLAKLRESFEGEYAAERSAFNNELEHVHRDANVRFRGATREDVECRIERELEIEERTLQRHATLNQLPRRRLL